MKLMCSTFIVLTIAMVSGAQGLDQKLSCQGPPKLEQAVGGKDFGATRFKGGVVSKDNISKLDRVLNHLDDFYMIEKLPEGSRTLEKGYAYLSKELLPKWFK